MMSEERELMKECLEKRNEYNTQLYKGRLMIDALENTLKQMDPLIEYEEWEKRFNRLSALMDEQKKIVHKRQRVFSLIYELEKEERNRE